MLGITGGGLDQCRRSGYTIGMKTAISISDDLFDEADRLAKRLKTSRSQLYSHALREYVARHAPDHVTKTMDRVCDEVGQEVDEFVSSAAQRVLERSEW